MSAHITPDEAYELHGLLHKLWSKSGTTHYDKQEWKRLEELIQKAILGSLSPPVPTGRGWLVWVQEQMRERCKK